MKKAILFLAAFALMVSACGGGDDDGSELPINDGAEPGIDAACAVGEPDCNDTPQGEPQDLPAPGDDEVVTDGMVVDGGLTVSEAIQTEATGVLAITGFVVAVGDTVRLCEALAESFPPQCGGESLELTNLDQIDPDEISSEGDVQWTDAQQTVFGEIIDGVLVATSSSQ